MGFVNNGVRQSTEFLLSNIVNMQSVYRTTAGAYYDWNEGFPPYFRVSFPHPRLYGAVKQGSIESLANVAMFTFSVTCFI